MEGKERNKKIDKETSAQKERKENSNQTDSHEIPKVSGNEFIEQTILLEGPLLVNEREEYQNLEQVIYETQEMLPQIKKVPFRNVRREPLLLMEEEMDVKHNYLNQASEFKVDLKYFATLKSLIEKTADTKDFYLYNFENEIGKVGSQPQQVVFIIDARDKVKESYSQIVAVIELLVNDSLKYSDNYKCNTPEFSYIVYRDHYFIDEKDKEKPWTTYQSNFMIGILLLEELMKLDKIGSSDLHDTINGELKAGAVVDALNICSKQKYWDYNNAGTDSVKHVFHFLLSPLHGKDYCPPYLDDYQEGCPCGLNVEDVIIDMRNLKLNYVVFSFNDNSTYFTSYVQDLMPICIANFNEIKILE